MDTQSRKGGKREEAYTTFRQNPSKKNTRNQKPGGGEGNTSVTGGNGENGGREINRTVEKWQRRQGTRPKGADGVQRGEQGREVGPELKIKKKKKKTIQKDERGLEKGKKGKELRPRKQSREKKRGKKKKTLRLIAEN